MLAWCKRFLTDETAFIGAVRAAIMGLGAWVAVGDSPTWLPSEVGAGLMALSSMLRAGDKNSADVPAPAKAN